jgi:hypothetical protein
MGHNLFIEMHLQIQTMATKALFFLTLLFLCGCKENPGQTRKEIVINFSNLDQYVPSKEHTGVTLLKSFILDRQCDSTANIFFANVFLCKVNIDKGDTLLVFNICSKAPKFLYDNYDPRDRDIIIDSSRVSKGYPAKVISNVDDSTLKKYHKYIVADLIKLQY